jgi:hypothetical protein
LDQWRAYLRGRGESVTRSDRRQREQKFESPLPPLTARPNRRREDALGLRAESSPLAGLPMSAKTAAKPCLLSDHFMALSKRRFALSISTVSDVGVEQVH